MKDEFFNDLKEKIQPYFEDGGHGFDHTERVFKNAINISENEDVDLDIVKVAALLHDIARLKESKKEISCHADEGAKIAEKILLNTEFPKEKIKQVCYTIEVHRYSKGLEPKTKEAEVIQDADRLDALGALIISRVFFHHGKHGSKIYDPNIPPEKVYNSHGKGTALNHFHEKILKIKPETFKTKKAREIAKERYAFVKNYVDRFLKEWDGEA